MTSSPGILKLSSSVSASQALLGFAMTPFELALCHLSGASFELMRLLLHFQLVASVLLLAAHVLYQ